MILKNGGTTACRAVSHGYDRVEPGVVTPKRLHSRRNQLTMTSFTARLWFFAPWVLFMTRTLTAIDIELSVALDSLPRSPRVGSQRIPLPSYIRVPISKLLANPTDYHLREIRIAGTVRAVETHLMTRGCGKHHELTVISLEDESGAMDVIDQGACGRNTRLSITARIERAHSDRARPARKKDGWLLTSSLSSPVPLHGRLRAS